MSSRPKIVLVHGAFANAGCWAKLVPLLRAKGLSVVGEQDYMLTIDLERYTAKRLGATALVLHSSHVPMISHPGEVADFIEKAANQLS